jgi:hypothetical protein
VPIVTTDAPDVPDVPIVTTDVPDVPDVPAVDLPITGECQRPADCGDPTFASVRWCPTSSWSCIDHQCVWECRGGRRCDRSPDGCVRCDDEAREHCPGRDACTPGWPDGGMMEESTCARAWTREPSDCFGPWARMRDGTLCSMQSLFTGVPRMVLACRRCQTTLEGIEPGP